MKKLMILLCLVCLLGVVGCSNSNKSKVEEVEDGNEKLIEAIKKENYTLCDNEEYCDNQNSYILITEEAHNVKVAKVLDMTNLKYKYYFNIYYDKAIDSYELIADKEETSFELVYDIKQKKGEGTVKEVKYLGADICTTISNLYYDFSRNKPSCSVRSYNCTYEIVLPNDVGSCSNTEATYIRDIGMEFLRILKKYDIYQYQLHY